MSPEAPLSFFVVGGAILILTGLLQAAVRPRARGEVGLARYFNRGTVWVLFCITFGLAAILLGTGAVRLGG